MLNTLPSTGPNFEVLEQRDYIMSGIFKAIQI